MRMADLPDENDPTVASLAAPNGGGVRGRRREQPARGPAQRGSTANASRRFEADARRGNSVQ